MFQPKTPTINRTRSDVGKTPKTPLTPSVVSGLGTLSLGGSPTKKRTGKAHAKSSSSSGPFDTSNPFIQPPSARSRSRSRPGSRPVSRPASPVKFASGNWEVTEDLKGQAGGGLIKKGGVELSRLDVVSRDYIPPKPEIKRSRSTPAAVSTG